jgi:hypothetical protein
MPPATEGAVLSTLSWFDSAASSEHRAVTMRVPTACTLALVLASAAPCATAQLFKWVDNEGVVNYGDWPPPGTRVQPITHGTVSSVSGGPKQQMEEMRPRDEQRRGQRTARGADGVSTPAPTDDVQYAGTYAADYGYPARRVGRAEAAIERPRVERPIAQPGPPVNLPAVPDMPLRPRR